MKKLLCLPLVAAMAACGGSSLNNDTFRANAPTFDKVAISQNDSDQAEPAAVGGQDATVQDVTTAPICHPHLFARTGEIIGRVNRHFFKLVAHVEHLIRDNPTVASGQTRVWEKVEDGLDRKLTMTAAVNIDGSTTYDYKLEVAAAGSTTPSFVTVATGSLTHSGPSEAEVADAGAASRVEDKGTVTFDYTALASVKSSERARGQITDAFDNVHDPAHGVKRSATLTLTNFLPEEGDPHGPRSGSYSWEREPGVGGKFQFQDSLVLLCPSNPNNSVADLTTVARWYKSQDGAVHGRSDSKATGGQIAGGTTWMGVTCAKGQTTAFPAEGYWMMKLESSAGATLSGTADVTGGEPCDPAFGAVPSVSDNTTDYDFSAAVTFPNEWQ